LSPQKKNSSQVNLLVLTITAPGVYIHDVVVRGSNGSLSVVEKNMQEIMQLGGHNIALSKSGACINPTMLSCFDVVFFFTRGDLNYTAQPGWWDPITNDNLIYLIDWIREGHGFVGVHPASGTFQSSQLYMDMIGGDFLGHSPFGSGLQFKVVDPSENFSQIVSHIPDTWSNVDEFYGYSFQASDLISLFNTSLNASQLQCCFAYPETGNFSNTWIRYEGQGRVFYTGLGHSADQWNYNDNFKRMLYKSVLWTGGYEITDINLHTSSHTSFAIPKESELSIYAFICWMIVLCTIFNSTM